MPVRVRDGELGEAVVLTVHLLHRVLPVIELLSRVWQVLNEESCDVVVGNEVLRYKHFLGLQLPIDRHAEVDDLSPDDVQAFVQFENDHNWPVVGVVTAEVGHHSTDVDALNVLIFTEGGKSWEIKIEGGKF